MKVKTESCIYFIAASVLAVVFVIAFYPGWMSVDSCTQYAQSLTGRYCSITPVMMSWWWRCLNYLHKGPELFLLQNQVCYWFGLGLIAWYVHRRVGFVALLVLLAGLFPSAIIITAQIWKDVVFTSLTVLSLGMILCFSDLKIRLIWQILFVVPTLVLAYGCKPNGLPVVIFLVFAWMFGYVSGLCHKVQAILACSLTVVILVVPSCIVSSLPVDKVPMMQYIQSHDLLGMGIQENQLLLPDWMITRTGITVETAPKIHYPGGNNVFFYQTKGGNLTSRDSIEIAALQEKWLLAILRYPMTYLKVRWQYFVQLLRLGSGRPCWIVQEGSVPNDWNIRYKSNFISRLFLWTTVKLPWLYLPWIYLLVSFLLTLSTVFLRKHNELCRLILGCGICGFLFAAPHYFVGPAEDFRYLHFSVICSLVQFSVLIGLLLRGKQQNGRSNEHPEKIGTIALDYCK